MPAGDLLDMIEGFRRSITIQLLKAEDFAVSNNGNLQPTTRRMLSFHCTPLFNGRNFVMESSARPWKLDFLLFFNNGPAIFPFIHPTECTEVSQPE